jgi:hypothetical protein
MMSSAKIQLIFAAVFLALMLMGYGAWYDVISSKSATAADLASQISAKQIDVTRLAAAKSALTKVGLDEAALGSHFVSTSDVVTFLGNLQSTGAQLGAVVTIVSVSANTTAAHPTLSLSVQIVGPFSAVLRTLGVVEYAPQYVTVDNLSLTSTAGAAGEATVWTGLANITVGASNSSAVPGVAPIVPLPKPATSTVPALPVSASTTPGATSSPKTPTLET